MEVCRHRHDPDTDTALTIHIQNTIFRNQHHWKILALGAGTRDLGEECTLAEHMADEGAKGHYSHDWLELNSKLYTTGGQSPQGVDILASTNKVDGSTMMGWPLEIWVHLQAFLGNALEFNFYYTHSKAGTIYPALRNHHVAIPTTHLWIPPRKCFRKVTPTLRNTTRTTYGH